MWWTPWGLRTPWHCLGPRRCTAAPATRPASSATPPRTSAAATPSRRLSRRVLAAPSSPDLASHRFAVPAHAQPCSSHQLVPCRPPQSRLDALRGLQRDLALQYRVLRAQWRQTPEARQIYSPRPKDPEVAALAGLPALPGRRILDWNAATAQGPTPLGPRRGGDGGATTPGAGTGRRGQGDAGAGPERGAASGGRRGSRGRSEAVAPPTPSAASAFDDLQFEKRQEEARAAQATGACVRGASGGGAVVWPRGGVGELLVLLPHLNLSLVVFTRVLCPRSSLHGHGPRPVGVAEAVFPVAQQPGGPIEGAGAGEAGGREALDGAGAADVHR